MRCIQEFYWNNINIIIMKTSFVKSIRKSARYWFIPLIVGILFIILGGYTIATPLKSYLALAVLFSLSFLITGTSEVIFAFVNRKEIENWGWSLSLGIITAIIGVLLIINPAVSLVTLPFYVGFLVLTRSIGAIGFALDLKNYGVLDWGNLMVLGVLGVLLSFTLTWNPVFAGMTVVFWTGLALISGGLFSIYFAFKMKKIRKAPGLTS